MTCSLQLGLKFLAIQLKYITRMPECLLLAKTSTPFIGSNVGGRICGLVDKRKWSVQRDLSSPAHACFLAPGFLGKGASTSHYVRCKMYVSVYLVYMSGYFISITVTKV